MNTKDFLRLGVPLGQATRRATDFISKFILGGGDVGDNDFWSEQIRIEPESERRYSKNCLRA
jgi:hypothetical protein